MQYWKPTTTHAHGLSKKKKKELNNHLRGNMIKEKRNVIRNDLSLWLFANIMWRLFPYNVFAWYNSVSGLLTGLF